MKQRFLILSKLFIRSVCILYMEMLKAFFLSRHEVYLGAPLHRAIGSGIERGVPGDSWPRLVPSRGRQFVD